MATALEDLEVLESAAMVADSIWGIVSQWDRFVRDGMGQQLTSAVDSVGANIAESFGRFHYGEKLNFLYFARGSLFETKYWLNRCRARNLLVQELFATYAQQLTTIAKQLNAFAHSLKKQKQQSKNNTLRETYPEYTVSSPLFTDEDLNWLASPLPTTQSPIPNLESLKG
ncbi:MAG: four helix bundle protein [Anaerolineales bacterium]|nr:four helix bundle protein [Anaerolineales bacterium]